MDCKSNIPRWQCNTSDIEKASHDCSQVRPETDTLTRHTYMTEEQDAEWKDKSFMKTHRGDGSNVIEARYRGLWEILNPGMPLPAMRKYMDTCSTPSSSTPSSSTLDASLGQSNTRKRRASAEPPGERSSLNTSATHTARDGIDANTNQLPQYTGVSSYEVTTIDPMFVSNHFTDMALDQRGHRLEGFNRSQFTESASDLESMFFPESQTTLETYHHPSTPEPGPSSFSQPILEDGVFRDQHRNLGVDMAGEEDPFNLEENSRAEIQLYAQMNGQTTCADSGMG